MSAAVWLLVLRSYTRSVQRLAVLGLVFFLMLALVVAQGVASNMSGAALLANELHALPYDYSVDVPTVAPETYATELAAIPSVTNVSFGFVAVAFGRAQLNAANSQAWIAGVADNFPSLASEFGWNGSFLLAKGATVISDHVAAFLQAQVGSTVQLGDEVCDPTNGTCTFRGLSYRVASIVHSTKDDGPFSFPLIAFLGLGDADVLYQVVTGQPFPPTSPGQFPTFTMFVWINRQSLATPLDPEGNLQRAAKLQLEMETVTGSIVESPLRAALQSYATQVAPIQALFLAFSFPGLLLAFFLSVASVDRASYGPLESVRILRLRGLSRIAGVSTLTLPLLAVAAIASALGIILLQPLLGLLLTSATSSTSQVGSFPSWRLESIGPPSLIPPLVLITVTFVVHARRSGWRVETVRTKWTKPDTFAPQVGPGLDYVLLAAGLVLWIYVALYGIIGSALPALQTIAGSALRAFVPISGVLVTLGILRLVLNLRRPRTALARCWARLSGTLGRHIVPSRVAGGKPPVATPLVIAIAVALILAGSAAISSEREYSNKIAFLLSGGGFSVDTVGKRALLPNLTSLPGVSGGTEVLPVSQLKTSAGSLVLFNATSYQEVVGSDPYFFSSLTGPLVDLLLGKPAVVLNDAASNENGLHAGDRLFVQWNATISLFVTVAGVVHGLPGLQSSGVDSLAAPTVYGDLDTLLTLATIPTTAEQIGWRFLLRLAPGTEVNRLSEEIMRRFSDVREIRTTESVAGTAPHLFVLATPFVDVEITLSFLFVLLAVGLTRHSELIAVKTETATFRVRGASRRSVAGLTWAESASYSTLGLLVGVGTGLLGAWFLVDSFSKVVDPSPFPRPFVIGYDALLGIPLFGVALLSILAAVSWAACAVSLPGILRERSQ